jgi:hypothetical protein
MLLDDVRYTDQAGRSKVNVPEEFRHYPSEILFGRVTRVGLRSTHILVCFGVTSEYFMVGAAVV